MIHEKTAVTVILTKFIHDSAKEYVHMKMVLEVDS